MRIHGTILGQVDTYLFHIENLVQDEVHGLVGQRRVSHSRTDALILFDKKIGYGKIFILGISPGFFADVLVHLFGSGLGQAVG